MRLLTPSIILILSTFTRAFHHVNTFPYSPTKIAIGYSDNVPTTRANKKWLIKTKKLFKRGPIQTSLNGAAVPAISASKFLFTLPTCTASNVHQIACVAGSVGLGAQILLYLLFRRSKDEVRRKNAGYTAHSIVALGLMLLVSWIGVVGWLTLLPASATSLSPSTRRLLVPVNEARWLSAVICGMFVAWDIPTSIAIGQLRKADVIVHHLVMAILAYFGSTSIPMYYLFYFFGISELSSVPLVIYDQLSRDYDRCTEEGNQERADRIGKLRGKFQIMAAIAFTMIRAVSFPIVSLFKFLPDVRAVLMTASPASLAVGRTGLLLRSLSVANIGFTILQLYWFSLIVKIATGMNNKE